MSSSYDVNNEQFIKLVHDAGLVIPKSEHTLWCLPKYKKRLERIWNDMEKITVTYRDETKILEIPLTIKGSMWHWVCEKPVANQNPYKKLLGKVQELFPGIKQDAVWMHLPTENTPSNFDCRTTKNDSWVKEMKTLSSNEIVITDKADSSLTYMERMRSELR